jgi:hypothetical protein
MDLAHLGGTAGAIGVVYLIRGIWRAKPRAPKEPNRKPRQTRKMGDSILGELFQSWILWLIVWGLFAFIVLMFSIISYPAWGI